MKKIKFTYEDVRNMLIRDMRAKYGVEFRPVHEVYQYYMQFAGCGCVAANAADRAFKNMSNDVPDTDLPLDLKVVYGVDDPIVAIRSELETIKKLTNNLENIWGIIKLARHMHLIKNTIHFEQQ